MNTVANTITILQLEEKTDLFCFYPRESSPQTCFLKLDIRNGELTADYDPEIGVNHCTRAEQDRLILTWPIPCLTKEAGNQLLQETAPLANEILAGADIEWNGQNHVGTFTEAAAAAIETVHGLIKPYQDSEEILSLVEVGDWYVDGPEAALRCEGLGAGSSDAEIRRAATDVEAEALGLNLVIDGDEVAAFLISARDELRAELEEELGEAGEAATAAVARRDAAIVRASMAGLPGRAIGEAVGLSHTGVQRILAKHQQ
jgi:hypothetical protein